MAGRQDVYARVTADLIAMMREGVAPWRMPWIRGANDPRSPHNPETGNYYRGVNRWNLAAVLWRNGWEDPRFVTYAGAKRLGGNVREGEKAAASVVFAKVVEKRRKGAAPDEDPETYFLHTSKAVFHVSQVGGVEWEPLPAPDDFTDWDPVEDAAHLAEAYLEAAGVPVTHGGERAFYAPGSDRIGMPYRDAFPNAEGYYATLFHEMAHSTGHESRLARKFGDAFGADQYAREELVAEITSAILYVSAGLDSANLENNAAYLRAWADRLEDSPRDLVTAANAAERAADYVLERVPERVA